jgi:hypothetical protein
MGRSQGRKGKVKWHMDGWIYISIWIWIGSGGGHVDGYRGRPLSGVT